LLRQGFDCAPQVAAELRAKDPAFQLKGEDLNAWGYKLLEQKQAGQAVAILRLNTTLFPKSWNAYDSLAKILEDSGNRAAAIDNYSRSLQINPANSHVAEHLRNLRGA